MSKDRYVHETYFDGVVHSRKSRNVGTQFFNYLQSRGAMKPKLNSFSILLYNFGSD